MDINTVYIDTATLAAAVEPHLRAMSKRDYPEDTAAIVARALASVEELSASLEALCTRLKAHEYIPGVPTAGAGSMGLPT